MENPLLLHATARFKTLKRLGFTLVELLVTLAILAILLVKFIPDLQHLSAKHALWQSYSRLSQSLGYARAVAALKRHPVIVCASRNQHQCDSSRDWSSGWIVVADLDQDYRISPKDELLWTSSASPRIRVTKLTGNHRVIFTARGSYFSNSRIELCVKKARHTRLLIKISQTGRMRHERLGAQKCN